MLGAGAPQRSYLCVWSTVHIQDLTCLFGIVASPETKAPVSSGGGEQDTIAVRSAGHPSRESDRA